MRCYQLGERLGREERQRRSPPSLFYFFWKWQARNPTKLLARHLNRAALACPFLCARPFGVDPQHPWALPTASPRDAAVGPAGWHFWLFLRGFCWAVQQSLGAVGLFFPSLLLSHSSFLGFSVWEIFPQRALQHEVDYIPAKAKQEDVEWKLSFHIWFNPLHARWSGAVPGARLHGAGRKRPQLRNSSLLFVTRTVSTGFKAVCTFTER